MCFRLIVLMAATLGPAVADKLILRDGTAIEGTYLGGDARTIRMAVGDKVESFSVPDVSAVQFGPAATGTAAEPAALARPVDAGAPNRSAGRQEPSGYAGWETTPGGVPAGTPMLVRMMDDVDIDSSRAGQTFRAMVDEPVMVNGQALIPRGTEVTGKLVEGRDSKQLLLTLAAVRMDGKTTDVSAEAVALEAAASGNPHSGDATGVLGGSAALVAIVAAAKSKDETAKSASGAEPLVFSKGNRIRIPSDSRVTFRLKNPVRL